MRVMDGQDIDIGAQKEFSLHQWQSELSLLQVASVRASVHWPCDATITRRQAASVAEIASGVVCGIFCFETTRGVVVVESCV